MAKILIIATSRFTRGGITSVVKAHEKGEQWKAYNCKWLETHIDKGVLWKLIYLLNAFIQFVFILPFYDLIHIHISEPPSAIRKCLFMWWAKIWKKKTIIHFHSFSPDTTIKSKRKNVYKYLFNKADLILVLSEYWKSEVNNVFFLNEKVKVLYNPCIEVIDKTVFAKTKTILFAGAINARKGYSDLIRAFSKIASIHKDWQLVFAGNGEIEQGKQLAQELGIEKQCNFVGWVIGAAKDKIFKEASIFCLPSYAEGFPMAVLDAWAYGLPVVSTPVGGLPDIAKDNENVLLFNPGDTDILANKIRLLIENDKLRERIVKASLDLANKTFSEKVINEQLNKFYSELLKW